MIATAWCGRRLARAAEWLTTPLLPDDYLGLVNPLWSASEPRGCVESVRRETADATTLLIRPGRGWAGHQPGHHLRVGVEIKGVLHWRVYSITSAPDSSDGLVSITVKALPGGRVSPHLGRHTAPGTVLRLGSAGGDFTLPDPVPPRLLLLTAGVGITPVMGILRALAARDAVPDTMLVHSAATPQDVVFGPELRELARRTAALRLHEHYTRMHPGGPGAGARSGRLTADRLAGLVPDWRERDTWACGPAGMLEAVERHWARAGIAEQLHVERFRVATTTAAGAEASGSGRVRFTVSGREADAAPCVPLLVVGEDAGVAMPSGCRMGICHSCVARLVGGRVRDLRTGRVHGEAGDLVQTCVSAAAGPVHLEL